MSTKTQYLQWHGQQYRVRMNVPLRLQPILGRRQLIAPLHTSDLDEANERKWVQVVKLKSILNDARKVLKTSDPLLAEALQLRLQQSNEDTQYIAQIRAEQIEKELGYATAKPFFDIATGSATPLNLNSEAFLAHQDDSSARSSALV